MPKTILQGPLALRLGSLAVLLGTSLGVLARRAIGRPLVPEWPASFEMGTLFWRRQFNRALARPDMVDCRACFDSVHTIVEPADRVERRPAGPGEPRGDWFVPRGHRSPLTLLYLHGGGYAFYGEVTRHFIASLAHWLDVPVFALDYRLTPEHPHPAQIDDALAAYRHLLASGVDPARLVVGGDSAGGHLTLMLLARLRQAGLPQPRLALALSPWTDIGRRGASQFGNDRYDMVQGWQTLRYAEWLKGDGPWTDAELSPIHQDFRGTAPVVLQAGSMEILVDMIRDFAQVLVEQGAAVRLDVWPFMTHEFQAYGELLPQSRQAIECLRAALAWAAGEATPAFPPDAPTVVDRLGPRPAPLRAAA